MACNFVTNTTKETLAFSLNSNTLVVICKAMKGKTLLLTKSFSTQLGVVAGTLDLHNERTVVVCNCCHLQGHKDNSTLLQTKSVVA